MTQLHPSQRSPSDPYCSNCGYTLKGLTESSKCPECGRPIVEVLTRPSEFPNFGKRYRSKATLFGLPVIDVALGPKDGEMRGKAKGIIAVGDVAMGGIAIGGVSVGLAAFGGLAVGLCSLGGAALGLLSAGGGLAIGSFAMGGCAVGIFANGGGAVGYTAQGGGAIGWHTRDGRTPRNAPSPAVFEHLSWFFGSWPPGPLGIVQPLLVVVGLALALAAVIGLVAVICLARTRPE